MIWTLLLVFQAKHFIADYPLQSNRYMIGKFKPLPDCLLPLAAHAGVHAVMTFIIAVCVKPSLWWLSLVDFFAHAGMDFLKANPKMMGRWKALSAQEYKSMANTVVDFEESKNGELMIGARLYREKMRSNTLFWNALGLDQWWHHMTHYLIIYLLVQP